jgi:DNA-binding NtrC family response regulator
MAKVLVVGIDQGTAVQILRAFPVGAHSVEYKDTVTSLHELQSADLVFAVGERNQSISLLRRIKDAFPRLPCIVAARVPDTTEWLDALEAGATDYCGAPFESGQMESLIRSALPSRQRVAA